MVNFHISDDRVLKVAGAYPGRSATPRKLPLKYNRIKRENRQTKTLALVGYRVLTTGEPDSARRREHKDRHATAGIQPSEQTVRQAHRVAEVSRGHIKPEETSPTAWGGLTLVKARTVPPDEWQG
ncbi:MAG: hypothetical protein DRH24_05645 [Deltaproteobacteria bacterium]|nr:MAG: hypothetical protein DRH24_05645 [Deltaproteobacteria bacterium]